jgi:hypothetical protein
MVAVALTALGCGSDSKSSPGAVTTPSDGGPPTIKITSPANGATVSPASDSDFPDVPVTLAITNFTLKAPASADCPSGTCGHVHLMVDGTACNDKETMPPPPYNSAATALSGPDVHVGLDYCSKIGGQHVITAELHNNDHSPVTGPDGKPIISDPVTITASGADGG